MMMNLINHVNLEFIFRYQNYLQYLQLVFKVIHRIYVLHDCFRYFRFSQIKIVYQTFFSFLPIILLFNQFCLLGQKILLFLLTIPNLNYFIHYHLPTILHPNHLLPVSYLFNTFPFISSSFLLQSDIVPVHYTLQG
jgi:hypothetical protein